VLTALLSWAIRPTASGAKGYRFESCRKEAWRVLWTDWHKDQLDSGTHSATAWALRTWEFPLPEIPRPQPRREGLDWQLTMTGLTMIRIPAGEVQRAVDESGEGPGRLIRIPHEFWISDCEVTVRQFQDFLRDETYQFEKPDYESSERPPSGDGDKDLPVTIVSWYDAVMYCNWLSWREGRDLCYRQEGKEQIRGFDTKIREWDAWTRVPNANGYRLPEADEWEYACRARTTTAFCFGNDEDLLDRYAVFVKNAKNGPDLVGRKLCNAWGLFDMHGNVWEWCQDPCDDDRSARVCRGGTWRVLATLCRAAHSDRFRVIGRVGHLGFRVVATPSDR
jgi:formylglycine-generating enzyme required for sulfatase activity